MAKKNKELIEAQVNAVLTVDTTLLNAAVDGLAKQITTSFSTAALKSVEGFVKKLRNSIQISFDDTVIGSLKSPIKITLDTKDASNKIKVLGKELEKIAIPLANIAKAEKAAQEAKKAQKIIDDAAKQKAKSKSPQGIIFDDIDAKKSEQAALLQQQSALINRQREKVRIGTDLDIKVAREEALKEARKLQNSLSIQTNAQGLFSDADIAKLEKNINKQKQLFVKAVGDVLKTRADLKKSSDDLAKEETRLKGIFNPGEVNKSKAALAGLHNELEKTIKTITKSGVPITTVTKHTSSYDRAITNLHRDLSNIEKEFKDGNITLVQAAKAYQALTANIRKLGVGIDEIDTNRIKKSFALEEADPKSLGIRFAGLGFTLGAVSNALLNFSRNTVQVFTNLAQVAEPIERVSNSLDLLVKNGQLTLEQKASTLETLREIGDLPGSTVETANQTFEQLKRINLTLSERLELTKGLAKLPATTGGVAKDTNQLANALTKAASGGRFEGQQFTTVLEQGGETVKKLNERLGIGSAEDINDIGVLKYIRLLSQELSGLESPALTTTDRINKLKSRFSEFGVIFGTIVAPALDKLNTFLRDTLQPILKSIGEQFKRLSPQAQTFISIIVTGTPAVIGALGALTAAFVTLNFAISSGINALKIFTVLGAKAGIGSAAKILAGGGAAATTGGFATLAGGLAGPVPLAGLAGGPAGPAAVAGLAGSATVGAAGGVASVGTLAKISAYIGNIVKSLSGFLRVAGPIGIVVNILLSSILAFFQNFNGVKDRLLSSLQKLDAPINKLLKAFGLEEGGLAQILGYIGTYISKNFEVIGVVISTVGGVIVEVASSIIQTFANIVDGIANVIDSLKNGNFTDALKSFFKLLYDLTIGFLVNLGINLVSLLLDAIASAIEAAFGEGVVGGIIRSAANSLRGLNGTDAESTAVSTREQKQKESDKRIQAERLKQQEELNELAKQEDESRRELLKQNLNDIRENFKKIKDESQKFQIEQSKDVIKFDLDRIKEQSRINSEFAKRGIALSSSPELATSISSLLKDANRLALQREIGGTARIGELDVLADLKAETSPTGRFINFFKAFENGARELGQFIDVLKKINASNTEAEALGLAKQLEIEGRRVGRLVDPQGRQAFSGIDIESKNLSEKAKSTIEANKIKLESIRDQAKKEEQSINDELDAKVKEINRLNLQRQNDLNDRIIKQKQLQEDINVEINKEISGRKGLNNEVTDLLQTQQRDSLERKRAFDKERTDLERERKQIVSDFEKDRENIQKNILLDANQKNILLNILNDNEKDQLENIDKVINTIKNSYSDLNKSYTELNKEQNKTLSFTFIREIAKQLKEITASSLDSLSKFINTFTSFKNAFKLSGGSGNLNPITILREEVDRLVKKEGLSKLSTGYRELVEIINKLEKGTLNAADATAFFVESLAKIKAQPEIDAFNKQLIVTNNAIKTAIPANISDIFSNVPATSGSTGISSQSPSLQQGIPVSQAGLEKLLGVFLQPKQQFELNDLGFKVQSAINKIEEIDTATSTKLNNSITEAIINNGKGLTKSLLDSIITVGNISEEQLTNLLGDIFIFGADKTKAILESLKLIEAKRVQDLALIQASIEKRLENINSQQEQALAAFDQDITNKNNELSSLDDQARFASASELIRIRKQQAAIKVQLIDFNFQRLDIETAYNIQKDIIQANGNQIEIARIKKDGIAKRKALLEERNKDIIAAVQEGGGNTDKFGNPVDINGNRINISVPKILSGTGDFGTEQETNTTAPTINLIPELTKTEQLTAVLKSINDDLNGVGNAARNAGNGVLELFNRLASGEGVINIFKDAIGGMKFDLQSLTEVFAATAEFGITAFADALGKAVADTLVNGGNFLKNLGKFFGDTLIMLGTQLLQIGIAAAVLATLGTFFPVLRPLTGGPEGFYAAGVASALGIGMILLGKAMGGGGGKAAATTSNTGASNSANSSAGNSGQVEYDPEKDPKLIYQKALRTEVYIDIKRDDGSIVKSIVRQVNRNPAFANLIGNGRTGFVL